MKRAAKTIILHSCDVENCEDTSATMVEPEVGHYERLSLMKHDEALFAFSVWA